MEPDDRWNGAAVSPRLSVEECVYWFDVVRIGSYSIDLMDLIERAKRAIVRRRPDVLRTVAKDALATARVWRLRRKHYPEGAARSEHEALFVWWLCRRALEQP